MKYLPEFAYIVPKTIDELICFLKDYGSEACILAGGTDLLINLKSASMIPSYVVDITRIKELNGVQAEDGIIIIGALATHSAVVENLLIRQGASFLAEAALTVGSTQIRNVGTVGGNIANASPAADIVPPLIALDTQVRLVSFKGERILSLHEIYAGPYRTIIAPEEFIADVRFKRLTHGTGSCFLKLARRNALAISRLSVAVALELGMEGKIKKARISPGSVLPMPLRIKKAEEILCEAYPGEQLFREAGATVGKEMIRVSGRRSSTPYKEPVISNMVRRALIMALNRCRKGVTMNESQYDG